MWIILTLLCAFFESLKNVLSNRALKGREVHPLVVAWGIWFFATPGLCLSLFFVDDFSVGPDFWWLLVADGLLDGIGVVLIIKAIKESDLSLVTPIIAFTPLFLLIFSPLIVGEHPSTTGIAGVLLIVVGSYVLNAAKIEEGFFKPLTSMLVDRGPRYMLIAAFVWSLTSTLHKLGVEQASPLLWGASVFIATSLYLTFYVCFSLKKNVFELFLDSKILIPIGITYSLSALCFFGAVKIALVTYVIALKRVSSIFDVLAGAVLFKEEGLKERLAGVVLMVAGVACISLS